MTDLSIVRHQEIFNPEQHLMPIHIIGAGATGSHLWLSLVELGLTNIHAYDFDVVEPHNLSNQLYLHEDVGLSKVYALARYYERKTGEAPPASMSFNNLKVDTQFFSQHDLSGIVFLLTDTMASRKEIFDNILTGRNSNTFLMIETRMGSNYGQIFCINPFDPKEADAWKDTLLDDDDPTLEVSACGTSISVGPTAKTIANLAVWQMINFLTDPLAMAKRTNMFLKPTMVATEEIAHG